MFTYLFGSLEPRIPLDQLYRELHNVKFVCLINKKICPHWFIVHKGLHFYFHLKIVSSINKVVYLTRSLCICFHQLTLLKFLYASTQSNMSWLWVAYQSHLLDPATVEVLCIEYNIFYPFVNTSFIYEKHFSNFSPCGSKF